MKTLLKTKAGISAVVLFVLIMAFAFQRVASRRASAGKPVAAQVTPGPMLAPAKGDKAAPIARAPERDAALAENTAYLDNYYEVGNNAREDHDRQGNPVIRRRSPSTPSDAGRETEVPSGVASAAVTKRRASTRLQGRPVPGPMRRDTVSPSAAPAAVLASAPRRSEESPAAVSTKARAARPTRFNPYGRVIKCELVFTIDSTNEQTPFVALVVEPVYNNGSLVIPAGAELHGAARPDRLRDRIFSGQEWVLVFPREHDRPNGRQLTVRGVALDRIEPDANGMTWGITDGSYGLEGKVIRTADREEIKRFLATFLAAGSVTLEERQSGRSGQQSVRNTPQNAVLQGLSADFERIAEQISAEIEQHGVFIRVPAGHQFYFYPMQIIDPDAADISTDIAAVK